MSSAALYYFPIRGRGEPIRLALSAAGVSFTNEAVNREEMKTDTSKYPFGQCPRLVIDDVDLTQSNAIVRFIGSKYDLFGSSLAENTKIDILLEGVESLRGKYGALIYQDALADEAKKSYWALHGDSSNTVTRNGGAHFAYLSALLKGSKSFAVGDKLSIADVQLFDIIDMHLRIFPEEMKSTYPDLVALHARIGETPGIKAYLSSPLRNAAVNGNGLG